MRPTRYVGVDYGEKRVGLARADSDTMFVEPYRVFTFEDEYDDDMEHLSIIIKGEADAIIVGLPLTREGTEGPMAKKVRDFAEDLANRTDLPVHFQDERMSTRANAGLLQGMRTEERKKLVDALAAAGILQTWLQKMKARNDLNMQKPT
jgi:putative Holliday junction resolvase